MSYSRTFAEFLQGSSFETLPEESKKAAKLFLLDLLGVIYSGSKSEPVRMVELAIRNSAVRGGESSIIPSGFKTSCLDAALVNGSSAWGISLNDIHAPSTSHPGAVVIPAALSVGEKVRSSGMEMLTAIILGYEIMGRIGKAIHPSHRERGFHPTATCGVFGAAAAASKLLGLNVEETIWALGNAGTQSFGLYAFMDDGAMTPTFYAGAAARNGIFAAFLAQEGFTGPEYILESKGGFFKAMADAYSAEKLCDGLGKDYEILRTGIKPYACCRLIHSSIDAALALLEAHRHLKPERIRNIIANVSPAAADHISDYNPQTPIAVRFSLPFYLAALLFTQKPPVEGISDELVKDKDLRTFSNKIKITSRRDFSRYTSEVEIRTEDGEVFSKKVEAPKGDPGNPFSTEEIENKFKILAQGSQIGEEQIRDIIESVKNLEDIEDISGWIEKLIRR